MRLILEVKFLSLSFFIENFKLAKLPRVLAHFSSINLDHIVGPACQRDGRCILMSAIIQGRTRKRQVILAHRRY